MIDKSKNYNYRLPLWVALGMFILSGVLLYRFCPLDKLSDFYTQRLQAPLFTGFLTLGSFLLTLKTFIVIKLKEGLYDDKRYDQRLNEQQALNPKVKISKYEPLKRLSTFLIYSVFASLFTAASQLLIGSFQRPLTALICLSLASMTLTLVFLAWWQIRLNLNDWFEILEKQESSNDQP